MTTAVRLRSALLLGLFLLGSLGVPLADGAIFHRAGQDPCAGVTHIEAHGGLHHADRCTLAQPIAPQQESLGSVHAVRIALLQVVRSIAPPVIAPRDIESVTLQHSRAPPA